MVLKENFGFFSKIPGNFGVFIFCWSFLFALGVFLINFWGPGDHFRCGIIQIQDFLKKWSFQKFRKFYNVEGKYFDSGWKHIWKYLGNIWENTWENIWGIFGAWPFVWGHFWIHFEIRKSVILIKMGGGGLRRPPFLVIYRIEDLEMGQKYTQTNGQAPNIPKIFPQLKLNEN